MEALKTSEIVRANNAHLRGLCQRRQEREKEVTYPTTSFSTPADRTTSPTGFPTKFNSVRILARTGKAV